VVNKLSAQRSALVGEFCSYAECFNKMLDNHKTDINVQMDSLETVISSLQNNSLDNKDNFILGIQSLSTNFDKQFKPFNQKRPLLQVYTLDFVPRNISILNGMFPIINSYSNTTAVQFSTPARVINLQALSKKCGFESDTNIQDIHVRATILENDEVFISFSGKNECRARIIELKDSKIKVYNPCKTNQVMYYNTRVAPTRLYYANGTIYYGIAKHHHSEFIDDYETRDSSCCRYKNNRRNTINAVRLLFCSPEGVIICARENLHPHEIELDDRMRFNNCFINCDNIAELIGEGNLNTPALKKCVQNASFSKDTLVLKLKLKNNNYTLVRCVMGINLTPEDITIAISSLGEFDFAILCPEPDYLLLVRNDDINFITLMKFDRQSKLFEPTNCIFPRPEQVLPSQITQVSFTHDYKLLITTVHQVIIF